MDAFKRTSNFLLKENSNLEIFHGNAFNVVPRLVDLYQGEDTSILLDGPKGVEAAMLADSILRKYKNVKFVAVHDVCKPAPKSYHCLGTYNVGKSCIYSDNKLFQKYDFINDLELKNKSSFFKDHEKLKDRIFKCRKYDYSPGIDGNEGYPGVGIVFNDQV